MPKTNYSTADGQKRLMAESMGLDSESYIGRPIDTSSQADHGCDPLGDGMFKMVPSGDIVNRAEKNKRLKGR